ncbi:MAG: hypothetical protein Q8R74_07735 [Methylophilus sp.]|nr:hypothetical protein [Methylophilus sp.]
MRIIACGMILLSMNTLTYADLAADLRQLRGAISETAQTGKELANLTGGTGAESPQSAPVNENVTVQTSVNEGDVLIGKLANIKLFKEPSKKAGSLGTLTKSDEMIYTGTQANGFYSVVTANKGDGWVEKMFVKKR